MLFIDITGKSRTGRTSLVKRMVGEEFDENLPSDSEHAYTFYRVILLFSLPLNVRLLTQMKRFALLSVTWTRLIMKNYA